ncbi:MAG: MBL fold metallo-hydrolase [Oceanicaulis sp.]
MFVETIKTEGLSHLSYLVGDGDKAAVIDPRRDYQVYEDLALKRGARIAFIFETHRNEDFISGAEDLARRTGAAVLRGPTDEYDVHYAEARPEHDRVHLGEASLEVLHTPGHTMDSISLVLRHLETGETPLGVFTGDALFVNDVGRTDFYPGREAEVSGLLYQSLHDKLLPLGDQTVVYPAHGAGSVCGQGMASRDFTTIGYERAHNPALQKDRDGFIEMKTAEEHEKPPYFKMMERLNAGGAPRIGPRPAPVQPLDADAFIRRMTDGMVAVDVLMAESFAGAHPPGAISLPLSMLPSFAGWLLPYDTPLGLIAASPEQAEAAALQLSRMGFDEVQGYLKGAVTAWATAGYPVDRIGAIDGPDFLEALEAGRALNILDVRSTSEFQSGHLEGAINIYAGEIPGRIDELDRSKEWIVMCGSGQRATIAASILQRAGFEKLKIFWGSMKACQQLGCRMAA